ncbi:hypothetical protein PFICI_03107 [Pestalotiopsis fici W106-1]|uniref:DOMON domain-containing protein n=1 Tax=Pestalotiopsis fici (strain W106-1 / CGMCC3.15140) TaxID=1229662 RepID=W3XI19_PESFW|nr:uncharacterized protein PFICI_03107 [Pestalotiopsis fici W106-1]ETS85082.1 hypothetical protein PFICI_03107 [Pestalotiopsis fici W106-1]
MALRTLIWTALLATLGLCWDPTTRQCKQDICLTSFIWCDPDSPAGDCAYPLGTYTRTPTPQTPGSAVLLEENNFNISWKAFHDGPVRIQWHMENVNADETSAATWEVNVTDSSYFIFRPGEVLRSFPTTLAPNMTAAEARDHASQGQGNVLVIDQPRVATGSNNDTQSDTSSPFTVQPAFLYQYFVTQKWIGQEEFNQLWSRGVGIGVGVGVPLLLIFSVTVTFFLTRRYVERQVHSFKA